MAVGNSEGLDHIIIIKLYFYVIYLLIHVFSFPMADGQESASRAAFPLGYSNEKLNGIVAPYEEIFMVNFGPLQISNYLVIAQSLFRSNCTQI